MVTHSIHSFTHQRNLQVCKWIITFAMVYDIVYDFSYDKQQPLLVVSGVDLMILQYIVDNGVL